MNYEESVRRAFKDSKIAFTREELDRIEYADFGLNNIKQEGLNLIIYINNDHYVQRKWFFWQDKPARHKHPHRGQNLEIEGKEETFRVRQGQVYLYVTGEPNVKTIIAKIPSGNKEWYTARHEIILNAGEQFTIAPNILHWFQAGKDGAIISEFSSSSEDSSDIFTNPKVRR
ncbi:D-lyxose/D-mannose family sugar isomerase [Lactococcus lactis]